MIFDLAVDNPYHSPTVDAVHHAVDALDADVEVRVIRTDTIDDTYFDEPPNAFVIGPGSPYEVPIAAEVAIAEAREKGIPLVGT